MKRIDTAAISRVSEMLRDMLGEDFDGETFWDTLDGETDAGDMLDRLLRDRAETLALSAAAKAQADDLRARATRLADRAKAYDKAMLTILDAAGERKAERPSGTVSKRAGSLSVQITDEASVPTQLCRVKTEPDKAAIKRLLDAGEDVPGACLTRGDDGVTVRVR